jgi:RNA polymerase sigma factor (sigma-70 family)
MNSSRSDGIDTLRQFIAEESDTLLRVLYCYVRRMGLADAADANATATELLSETTVAALEHAERFDPSRQPRAWLLGIATNLIRRRQATLSRQHRREPLLRDLYQDAGDSLSDEELFDRLAAVAISAADPATIVEADGEITSMLAGLAPGDQQILRLAILHGLDGDALADELAISPGAARVRLHRALRRLRAALTESTTCEP